MFSIYRYPWRCRIHIIRYISWYSIGCLYALTLVAELQDELFWEGEICGLTI